VKVGVIIPSIRPDDFQALEKTAKYFPPNFEIILIAQSPYDSRFNFKSAKYFALIQRRKIPSMVAIRALAYEISSEYDFYLIFDDDLILTKECTNFFNKCVKIIQDNDLGVLSTFKNYGPEDYEISPEKCIITTNRGIFIKNIGELANIEERQLLGGMEEPVFVFRLLANGYKHGIISNSPVYRHKTSEFKIGHKSIIHDWGIVEQNCKKYVIEKYNLPFNWDFLSGELPKF